MSTSVSILGNTGSEVTLRQTQHGTVMATFSIASNSFRNTPGGKEKKTDWYNVTAFGKLAENLSNTVRKGTHLLVRGSLTFNPWLTRNNEPRVSADVILKDFEFAGSRADEPVDEDQIVPDEPSESGVEVPAQAAAAAAGTADEPFVNQF
ncbi:MAG: single-stranded DNA-binding protein [Pyrinomonadaceae bacterium]